MVGCMVVEPNAYFQNLFVKIIDESLNHYMFISYTSCNNLKFLIAHVQAETLSHILSYVYEMEGILIEAFNMHGWDIVAPRGILNCG